MRRLLETLPPEAKAGTLVDYGCGKGRVLLLAAEAGFVKIVGVEFDPALAKVARQNLSHRLNTEATTVDLHVGDAALFDPPEGLLTVFLYNPFGGETLRRVAQRLAKHARNSAEPMWILYVNPVGLAEFTDAGFAVNRTEVCRGHTTAAVLSWAKGRRSP